MSGQQWGGIVGAAIGFYVAGPTGAQWGYAIGAAVGGWVDPTVVKGVQLGDLQPQASVSGNPIAIVFGTNPAKGCRVICQSEIRIRTEEDDGKGSGTVVENEVAYQDFTIEVCESSELRGTSVSAILVVWQDGQIVYDARPDPLISNAESSKWKKNVTFYYGAEDQLPDPTEESYLGVGQIPAYRGKCRMVFENRNITKYGNRIPNFECLVSSCAVVEPPVAEPLEFLYTVPIPATCLEWDPTSSYLAVGGYYDETEDTFFKMYHVEDGELVEQEVDYTFTQRAQGMGWAPTGGRLLVAFEHGAIVLSSIGSVWEVVGTIPDPGHLSFPHIRGAAFSPSESHIAIAYAFGPAGGGGAVCLYDGDTYDYIIGADVALDGDPEAWQAIGFFPPEPLPLNNIAAVALQDPPGLNVFSVFGNDWGGGPLPGWPETTVGPAYHPRFNRHGTLAFVTGDSASGWIVFDDGITLSSELPSIENPGTDTRHLAWSPEGLHIAVGDRIMRNSAGVYSLFQDLELGATGASSFSRDGNYFAIGSSAGVNVYTGFGLSAAGIELPDSPGYYYDPATGQITGPEFSGEPCSTTAGYIVQKAAEFCGIPDAQVVTTEIDLLPVRGYTIQTTVSGRGAIDPLCRTKFFDVPEFDGALRCHRRGSVDIDRVIDPGEMLDIDSEEDDDQLRGQQFEYPKKHHLRYIASDVDYVFTDAIAERTSPDIRVVGETSIEAPISLNTDEAAQIADIQLKVIWTEREDVRKFGLPLENIELVGGSILQTEGRRFRLDDYRIEDGAIFIERAAYDRVAAYSSNARGPNANPTNTPPSTILGPTIGVAMNLPALRVEDDRAGLYFGGTGVTTGWYGYSIETTTDPANGFTLRHGAVAARATIGALTSPLPAADRDYTDEVNTLTVRLYAGELNSIEELEFYNGGNAAAILYPDGTAEIINFRDAVETAPLEYELDVLQRGRLDTVVDDHPDGAIFVMLNNALRFIDLQPSDLGETIVYRLATLGTPRADNDEGQIPIDNFESQREWSPTNVEATRDVSDDVIVTWDGRPALGTNVQPQHHAAFVGYQVAYSDGVITVNKMVPRSPLVIVGGIVTVDEYTAHGYTAAEQTIDFGSVPPSLDIEVSAVNSITGAGPATGITV